MLELGKELKQIRESKGYSLDDVYKVTRVNKEYLDKLENGDFSFMPQIYIRSFYKSYLHFLSLNEKEYLKKLDEIIKSTFKRIPIIVTKSNEEEIEKPLADAGGDVVTSGEFVPQKKNKTNPVIYIALAVLVIITIIFYNNIKEAIFGKSEVLTRTSAHNERYSEEKQIQQQDTNKIPIPANKKLELKIQATGKVWIQVAAEGKNPLQALLNMGDERTFTSEQFFDLLIGSVGNVQMQLNGKPIPIFGAPNLIRRVRIDTSGVKYLTVPLKNQNKKNKQSDPNG